MNKKTPEDLLGGVANTSDGKPRPNSSAAGTIASKQLKAFVERVERLEEEKKGIAEDIRDVYAEAKGQGFNTKIMRQVVRLRKKDVAERQEEEALLDLYLHALGMLVD